MISPSHVYHPEKVNHELFDVLFIVPQRLAVPFVRNFYFGLPIFPPYSPFHYLREFLVLSRY